MKSPRSSAASSAQLVLGLGSNAGDREATLRWALGELDRLLGPLRIAPLYRSRAISPIEQPDFFNTVALAPMTPDLPSPEDLLGHAKRFERDAGRRPTATRDAPRPLDIDLLICGTELRTDPALTLPHPRLRERRFVLAPLCDLAPDLLLPPDGITASACLAALGTDQEVEKIGWTLAP